MKPLIAHEIGEHNTLYVVVDGDKCRKNGHPLMPVMLNVELFWGKHLQMEGQYCYKCQQNQVSRNLFADKREFHDQILAKCVLKGLDDAIDEPVSTFEYVDYPQKERAEESVLKKHGYTVDRNSTLSNTARQELLQILIEKKIVSKGYVITYLESNIRINGKKESNHCALQRWKSDLDFVLKL